MAEEDSYALRKLDQEERRLRLDERDMALKELLGRATVRSTRSTVLVTTLAAFVGFASAAGSSWIARSGTIAAAQANSHDALMLQRQNFQAALIQQAIAGRDRASAIEALTFIGEAGLIDEYRGRVEHLATTDHGSAIPATSPLAGVYQPPPPPAALILPNGFHQTASSPLEVALSRGGFGGAPNSYGGFVMRWQDEHQGKGPPPPTEQEWQDARDCLPASADAQMFSSPDGKQQMQQQLEELIIRQVPPGR